MRKMWLLAVLLLAGGGLLFTQDSTSNPVPTTAQEASGVEVQVASGQQGTSSNKSPEDVLREFGEEVAMYVVGLLGWRDWAPGKYRPFLGATRKEVRHVETT